MTTLYWLGEHTDEFGITVGMTATIDDDVFEATRPPACPLQWCNLNDHRLRPVDAAEYDAVMSDDAILERGVQPQLPGGED